MPPIRNAVESKALPRRPERAQIDGGRRNDSLAPPIGMAGRRPVCAGGAVLRAARARGRVAARRPPTIRRRSPTAGSRAPSTAPSRSMRSRRRSMPTTPISPRALSISPTIAARRCRRSSGSASQAAVDDANSASAAAGSFASGLITGEPKDMVGLAGTALGDLFVFGDIRDAVREGSRYVSGENYDQLILGLSVVGIAITAGTYATVGAATPARLGLTAVKVARKTGRLSARLGRLDRPLGARCGRLVGAEARRRRRHRACGCGARRARGGQGREGGRSGAARQRRRPGADQGRHPGRARRAQARRRAARDVADRRARREEGQQDAGDPQDARPRRDPAVDRLVQSRGLGARRDPDAVRLRVLGQSRGRARDASGISPARRNARPRVTP